MKAIIDIDMGNAAFEGGPGYELGRILRNIAAIIEGNFGMRELPIPLYDANGNKVGTFNIEPD